MKFLFRAKVYNSIIMYSKRHFDIQLFQIGEVYFSFLRSMCSNSFLFKAIFYTFGVLGGYKY